MLKSDLTTTITKHIQDEFMNGNDGYDLQPDTRLVEHRIIDSIGIFRLVAFLEEQFDIEIEASDVLPQHFATVAAIVDLVAQKTID